MAKIPEMTDLTLLEVDKALEEKQKLEGPRHYLGMSSIGEECRRKLFYGFRNSSGREFSASGIKAIQDGFLQEDVMIERLKMLPFIELHNDDGNGNQIGFSLLLDHFRGHADGMILGIKESPKTWHVWEHKSVNETKFKKIQKLKNDVGEKNTLIEWDIIYYGQAQIYMHCSGTTRHYLTVTSPGGRAYTSCRTEYNKQYAENLIEKAKSIIFDNWVIPARLSESREFYKCKWCEHSGICHDGEFPLVNCKTCRYSEPAKDGKRNCLKKNIILNDNELNLDTCKDHIYNPALIPAKLIEQQEDCCVFETENGYSFANCTLSGLPELKGNLEAIYTSNDLKQKIKSVNGLSGNSVKVQQTFKGEMYNPSKKAWDKQNFDERLKDV